MNRLAGLFTALLLLTGLQAAQAQVMHLEGRWFRTDQKAVEFAAADLLPVDRPARTGGRYVYLADFELDRDAELVLDFRNSSVIGRFHHRVFDASGILRAEFSGGLQDESPNPYFLRHGRDFSLPAGHYRLQTELDSPFLLAQPTPYLDSLDDYRQRIKPYNALTMLCLGILGGLAFYYAVLAMVRRNVTDALYSTFILGNLLYNGMALLVFSDLFGVHAFYLISWPILFSNMAYVVFVMHLLGIASGRLHAIGRALLVLLAFLAALGLLMPNWSLEIDRLGVGLFLSFGLAAGISQYRRRHPSARLYLLSIATFSMLGMTAIVLEQYEGSAAFFIEHLGLIAVTAEALLLALVLARQFDQLNREKEQAISDNLDKRRFLAAASHDLRQPMQALILFAEELDKQVDTPQLKRLSGLINDASHAMSGLLEALMDVSRLDAGMVTPQLQSISLSGLLERMRHEFAGQAAAQGVTLVVRPCEAWTESDPMLLERILSNLLSNAIRYTPAGGRVLLACRKCGGGLRLEVRDNGIGIPPEKQQEIFLEFVQLENRERSREKGLGLGLSIVKRLCSLLHYPLILRSLPGRGSVFSVTIPHAIAPVAVAAPALQATSAPVLQNALQDVRILLVEDDAIVRNALKSLLTTWGGVVQMAGSMNEAYQLVAAGEFDLMICDYRLPDGTGVDLIDEVEQFLERRLPALLISGDTAPEVLQAVKQKELHLLNKPVKPAKLYALLIQMTRKLP